MSIQELQMPKFSNFKLLKHQKVAARRFLNQPHFGLIWDCGTGKTLGAFAVSYVKQLPTIIIAPKALTDQWKESLVSFGVSEKDIFVYDSTKMKTKRSRKSLTDF